MERADDWLLDRARPDDGPAMLRLARLAYAMYTERIGREPAPMTADYDAIAAAGDALLARRGDEVMGMLVTHLEATALLVVNIAVSPDAQGSGLGSRLLAEAERIARDAGRNRVRLYTNEAMAENLAFYPRRGYRETHRRTEDGYRRVFFEKHLES